MLIFSSRTGEERISSLEKEQVLGWPTFLLSSHPFSSMDTLLNVAITCMPSCFSCVWLFATPWTITHQTPLSIKLPGKNIGVGCHFLLQGLFPSSSHLCTLHWQVYALLLTNLESLNAAIRQDLRNIFNILILVYNLIFFLMYKKLEMKYLSKRKLLFHNFHFSEKVFQLQFREDGIISQ